LPVRHVPSDDCQVTERQSNLKVSFGLATFGG